MALFLMLDRKVLISEQKKEKELSMNFYTNKILFQDNGVMFEVLENKPLGVKIFYYLYVASRNVNKFKIKLNSKLGFNLKDYGAIIHSGYGDPSEFTKIYALDKLNKLKPTA